MMDYLIIIPVALLMIIVVGSPIFVLVFLLSYRACRVPVVTDHPVVLPPTTNPGFFLSPEPEAR